MNIMQKLTLRHLKENKRRTLVTVIGTIISVAMITAVATLAISFLDLIQRQEIADRGEWHVQYHNVSEAQAEAIKNDVSTKGYILSGNRGYSYLEGSQNEYKPYIFVKEYNEGGFENFPIALSEGRLPETPDEIVLSVEIMANAKVEYEIGDELSLEIGERVFLHEEKQEDPITQQYSLKVVDGEIQEIIENTVTKTYKVVGIIDRPTWEPAWSPGYTAITYTDETFISSESPVSALVILNKVDRSIYNYAEQLASKINLDTKFISYNNDLLRYYGVTNNDNLNSTMFSLVAVIMSVIIIGSVALIYNAFAISVSERARHLGMLSSVGATKRQKRNSVFFEGAVIGVISIPLGVVFGLLGIGVTFWFINRLLHDALNVSVKLTVVVTPMSILIAALVSMLTIFISTYLPARKASRISAIDAIRQTTDIKLTGKAVKTSKLVRRLFGMEAEIGLKNLKRNKRKYQITVFSLVVSIVLFLTVSFFTESLEKSIDLSQANLNYDIQLTFSQDRLDEQFVQSITSLEEVTDFSIIKQATFQAMVDESNISAPLKDLVKEEPDLLEQGKYPYYVDLYSVDDETLVRYAEKVGMNTSVLFDKAMLPAIVIEKTKYEDSKQGKFVEIETIQTSVGGKIDLYYQDWENEQSEFVDAITIGALTDELPMGVTYGGGVGGLTMFVSEEIFNELLTLDLEKRVESNISIYLESSDPLKTQEEIEELNNGNTYIYNVYKSRQQNQQMILLMSVFIYGFITLITVISIANIFNTISTSISLRKREFAMLKSVGMTPKSFNKMINYESIFYGVKALLYGVPVSIGIMYLLHRSMMNTFEYRFELPWMSILSVVIAVFIIVGTAMLYSISKVRRENIIETLKQENI
ncbi:FtsX-like permease family protein [Halalkalibacter akibai]|uniref:ABC transporter ATP-binding protein n=1 Tax=Halalkalibacter akibai (strain ATCC 43226 / DSM 21942 / CIP 109018 / JCM 9157 / 1139) TaxID=1236973 RepID=W4QS66_HALA3|nr:FtsX-like permease family protein [Halalkalibacter akibai]GAE34463.1 ABC transporter ATP-binding protein [Halalkalibacter akibai JCM 9157]